MTWSNGDSDSDRESSTEVLVRGIGYGKEKAVKRYRSHKKFWENIVLAFWVSIWAGVWSLPVMSTELRTLVFGTWGKDNQMSWVELVTETNAEGNDVYVSKLVTTKLCRPGHVGYVKYFQPENKAQPEFLDTRAAVDKAVAAGEEVKSIWCGLLPVSYRNYWPNVATMLLFTVKSNTGTTVCLAWQGVVGTWFATIFVWMLHFVYPHGAKECLCGKCISAAINSVCTPGDMHVREDPHYSEWVCMVLTLIVIFLFLISGANENTIKFGLTNTVFYMMNFMNPAKGLIKGDIDTGIPHFKLDSDMTMVMVSAIVGSILSIIATCVPCPMTNISWVSSDAESFISSVSSIWAESIEYFCGPYQTPTRFQIEEKIDLLNTSASRIEGNLSASWWETFDIGRYGRIRLLYGKLDAVSMDVNDVMYAVQTSILTEEFHSNHIRFCTVMKPSMMDLQAATSSLMRKCIEVCKDGNIDDEEFEVLQEGRDRVVESQARLLEAYNEACAEYGNRAPVHLPNENNFVFALSFWARKITDFAEKVASEELQTEAHKSCWRTLISNSITGLQNTFGPKNLTSPDHLKFAARNWVTVSIAFLIGFYAGTEDSTDESTVFVRYSGTMATTLSLLISRFPGSAMQKNIRRLLGVTLGNVLPILVYAAGGWFTCGSTLRFLVHTSLTMLYTFVFTYIMFASMSWSMVGGLIVGFGIGPLLRPCDEVYGMERYAAQYKKIGQVTVAIMIKLVVDQMLTRRSPKDLAVNAIAEMRTAFEEGFEAFWDGDLEHLKACTAQVQEQLKKATDLAPETDPKLEVVRCMNTPFKNEMFERAIEALQKLHSDLCMLIVASKDWQAGKGTAEDNQESQSSGTLEIIRNMAASESVKRDLMERLRATLETLKVVLEHSTEEPIEEDSLRELAQLPDRNWNLYKGLLDEVESVELPSYEAQELTSDIRSKVCVALWALRHAEKHVASVEQLCLKADIY